jgi:hypothetical protein
MKNTVVRSQQEGRSGGVTLLSGSPVYILRTETENWFLGREERVRTVISGMEPGAFPQVMLPPHAQPR